jgi:magnesium transporter
LLHPQADVVKRRLAVADRDDEIVADEDLDLAELDGLLDFEVARSLQDEEERVAVDVELRTLVRLDRVLDRDIREIEGEVFSHSRSNQAERIYKLKREVLELHDAVAPLVNPVDRLARGHHEHVHEEVRAYFRDVHDHLLRTVAEVESFRDLLTSVLAANLTQVSVRQNEDVRRISAWAAIIAIPTMIAGIYGMNFRNMPELDSTYGYPVVLAVIVAACASLYTYFWRIGWL